MFRSNNPVISKFENTVDFVNVEATYQGVSTKVALLVLVAVLAATSVYFGFLPNSLFNFALVMSGFGGTLCVLLGMIFPTVAKFTSWIYSFCEGVLIGVLCYLGEQYVPGISIMAISITATIFISMLILYSSKIVIVTSKFKRIFMTVFFSMFISSLILTLVHYFSNGALTGFVDSYGFTLVVSVLYTALASVMLFMDFERIRFAVNNRIDKKYEWVLALGLMITLIWLFVEVFKLILIVAQRDN